MKTIFGIIFLLACGSFAIAGPATWLIPMAGDAYCDTYARIIDGTTQEDFDDDYTDSSSWYGTSNCNSSKSVSIALADVDFDARGTGIMSVDLDASVGTHNTATNLKAIATGEVEMTAQQGGGMTSYYTFKMQVSKVDYDLGNIDSNDSYTGTIKAPGNRELRMTYDDVNNRMVIKGYTGTTLNFTHYKDLSQDGAFYKGTYTWTTTTSISNGQTATAWANSVVDTDDVGAVTMDVTVVCAGY